MINKDIVKKVKNYKPLNELSKAEILWKLFVSTISISLVAFGGGFVMLPLIKKRYVDSYKWLKESEISDFIALAQASPGTIIGNSTMLIGYRVAGILGAMVTMIASIIPPFLVISVIFFFYEIVKDSNIVIYLMSGMQAGVAAVIIDLVLDMAKKIFKTKNIIGILIMLTSFAVTFFLKFSVIWLILIAITIGIATAYIKSFKEKKNSQNKDKDISSINQKDNNINNKDANLNKKDKDLNYINQKNRNIKKDKEVNDININDKDINVISNSDLINNLSNKSSDENLKENTLINNPHYTNEKENTKDDIS